MPATVRAGSSRARVAHLPALAVLLLLAVALAVPARAADDSNAGQLTQVPTVSSHQLNSALGTLAQGSNDTQLQQLISQFQSQMNSGDYSRAASTLVELQGLSSAQQGSVPPSLNALLQSLSVGSNGATVNANTLSSLLGSSSASGGASTPASQQKLSVDLQTLAGLMQYANSTLASELLQNSSLLSQQAPGAIGGRIPSAGAPASLPGVSGFPGLSVPSLGAPSVPVGSPSAGLPSVPLTAFLVPMVVAAAAAALFLSRGRIARIVGSGSFPGAALLRGRTGAEAEAGAAPSDPRGRIEFYFGRATRLMARRGVSKLGSETHREFSTRCEATPERPHVSTISSLYEKAKFSGQTVGAPDADLAASELSAMGGEER